MLATILACVLFQNIDAFHFTSKVVAPSSLHMSTQPKKGAGFSYDPSNYKDSNSVKFICIFASEFHVSYHFSIFRLTIVA